MAETEQIECECGAREHCPYLWDIITTMRKPGEQYGAFRELTDERYPHCTLTEKLSVYLQHHPIRAVAFLEELIRALHPEETHDDPSTD